MLLICWWKAPAIGIMFRNLFIFSVFNSSINLYVGRSPTKNEMEYFCLSWYPTVYSSNHK